MTERHPTSPPVEPEPVPLARLHANFPDWTLADGTLTRDLTALPEQLRAALLTALDCYLGTGALVKSSDADHHDVAIHRRLTGTVPTDNDVFYLGRVESHILRLAAGSLDPGGDGERPTTWRRWLFRARRASMAAPSSSA